MRPIVTLLLALCLSLSVPGPLLAQQTYRFNHLTADTGLPQGDIYSIVQDRLGFMWFGTATGGLLKYDGYDLTVYKHSPFDSTSLSHNRPYTLIEGRAGELWIGTWAGGLNRFDPTTERFSHYRHAPDDPNSLSTDFPAFIHEAQNGDLWILSLTIVPNGYEANLDRLEPDTRDVTRYRHSPTNPNSLTHDLVAFSLTIGGYLSPAFLEDRQGTVWVGTPGGGLNRLDPTTGQITRFQHDPTDPGSLSHNDIYYIFEDRSDRLWVGTRGGGLNLMDRTTGTFTHYRHNPSDPGSLAHDVAAVTWEDQQGMLWVTTAAGLDRLDPVSDLFTHFRHTPNDPTTISAPDVIPIHEEEDGDLWLISCCLDHFDPSTGIVTRLQADPENPGSLHHSNIHTAHIDNTGILWVGTSFGTGLHWADTQSSTFIHYQHEPGNPNSLSNNVAWAIHEDRTGVLWVSNYGVLNRLDRSAQTVTRIVHDPIVPNRQNHYIDFIHEDQAGDLWVTTASKNLDKLNPSTAQFTRYRHAPGNADSLSHDLVSGFHSGDMKEGPGTPAFLEDQQGIIWVGTQSGGLNRYERATDTFTAFRHDEADSLSLSHDDAYALFEDRQGQLWIGTRGGGLNRFDPQTETFTRYQHDATDPHSLSDNRVLALFEDRQGNLWIGTEGGGLNKFDRQAESFTRYGPVSGEPNNFRPTYAVPVFEDRTGHIWLFTYGGVHVRFDPQTEVFTPITTQTTNLQSDTIWRILEDESGNLWMSTNGSGLVKFDLQTETFRTYGPRDGVQSLEFNWSAFYKSESGEFFLGGINGFNAFYPDQIRDNPFPPRVALTGLRLFDEPVPVGEDSPLKQPIAMAEHVTLTHDQNDLTFEYAGLHFLNPEQNTYRYKLDNYEDAWRDVGTQRSAIYPNLPPGNYTFRVTAANSDGVWNEQGTALRVIIHPPWWQTTWAYVLYGLLFLTGIFAVDRVQRRRVIRQEQEKTRIREAQLQAEAAEEKAEVLAELDQMKTRFFVNLSHEFRTPLTLILGPLHDALDGAFGDLDASLQPHLSLMQRNGARLLRLINQLLDLSKLAAGSMTLRARRGNLVPFLRRIVGAFASRAERQGLTLDFVTSDEEIDLYFEPDKLEKIVTNLLSNAFKFTPDEGTIRVSVESKPEDDGGYVEIIVKDSGQGIPTHELPHIFDRFHQIDGSSTRAYEGTGIGLALVQELVSLHSGTIHAESEVGFGTTFIVRLPQGTAHLGEAEVLDESRGDALPEIMNAEVAGLETSLQQVDAVMQAEASQRADAPLVLIVEDHADVRAYLKSHLASLYRVEEAEDGMEGLEKARMTKPALVISDVMMPRMDGYELCRTLKTDATLNHIPVILLTARADEESKVEGLETGADDYLYKPFSAKELLTRAENLIEIRRMLRQRFSGEVLIGPSEIVVSSAEGAFVERVRKAVEAHLGDTNFGVDWLADEVSLSKRQLQRRLRAATDLSAAGYIRSMRLQRAAQLLGQQSGTVSEVAYAVGFRDVKYFSKLFYQIYGVYPSQYEAETPDAVS